MGNHNYYNSDLNQYIGENLPKVMTSIDLDLLQVKKRRKIIRFAEYKHNNEQVGYQQNEALKKIADIARFVNSNSSLLDGWTIEVFLIRGNIPFDEMQVHCYVTNKDYHVVNKDKINKFLVLE